MGFVKFGAGGFGLGGSPALVRGRTAIVPPFLTGTLMDTLDVTVWPGSYPYVVNAYGHQMQVSDDGLTGWADFGPETAGTTFTLSGVNGKYIRVVETAFGIGRSEASISAPVGPVVDLVELPALPMATGAKLMSLGHSFIQRGAFSNNMGVHSSCVRGAMSWVRLWDHRYNTDMWYDASLAWMSGANQIAGSHSGVAGDHLVKEGSAPGTIERTPWIAARQPNIVHLDNGTNDISSGDGVTSAAHVITRLDRQMAMLRNEGIWCVIQTITDRGAWPEGSEKALIVAGVNAWIKAQSGRDGLRVLDITGLGFNYPTFDASLFGSDILHPNPKGGKAIASALLPILQEMVEPGETWNLDPADGNIWPSNGLLGTTGTISASYGSGQVATGHRVTRNSGSAVTAVCSKEVIDGAYEKQVIQFTSIGGGARGENWRFVYGAAATLLSALGLVEGDWFEMLMYLECSASPLWNSISLQAELYQSTTLRISSGTGFINPDDGTQDLPLSEGWSGWLRMMPTLVQGGVDRFRLDSRPLSIDINATAPGTGVMKISKPIIRKCADPRPAWNLAA